MSLAGCNAGDGALDFSSLKGKPQPIQKSGIAFDTIITITVYDSDDTAILDDCFNLCNEYEKKFGFFYIGHYGNWEWLASFPLWLPANYDFAQIYHPLRSKGMDRIFLRIREQYHGRCIPMKDTLRQILTAKRDGKSMIVGFIADQSPKWEAMHHWTTFLNHKTSFFIGTEKIGKKVDAALFYVDVERPSRGYYRLHAVPLTYDVRNTPDFECTDRYAALLEQAIRREPHLWLWTHNRWKRTYEEWVERQSDKARSTVGAIS